MYQPQTNLGLKICSLNIQVFAEIKCRAILEKGPTCRQYWIMRLDGPLGSRCLIGTISYWGFFGRMVHIELLFLPRDNVEIGKILKKFRKLDYLTNLFQSEAIRTHEIRFYILPINWSFSTVCPIIFSLKSFVILILMPQSRNLTLIKSWINHEPEFVWDQTVQHFKSVDGVGTGGNANSANEHDVDQMETILKKVKKQKYICRQDILIARFFPVTNGWGSSVTAASTLSTVGSICTVQISREHDPRCGGLVRIDGWTVYRTDSYLWHRTFKLFLSSLPRAFVASLVD